MNHSFIVGVNTAMFDGIDLDIAFHTVQQAGFNYVELAYNQGYVGNLSDDLFSEKHADYILGLLDKYQLQTQTLGCTMNLASEDAVDKFIKRIRFARQIGATYLAACIGKQVDRQIILSNLRKLASIAEENHCIICIENGGDANFDVFSLADDGLALLDEIDNPSVAFNVDAGNIVSLCPNKDAIQEAIAMLPGARHCHIKDVGKQAGEYFFPAIGQGILDYRPLLTLLEKRTIPCSLEIPLRMHRRTDGFPVRADMPVNPQVSLEVLLESRSMLEKWLDNSGFN